MRGMTTNQFRIQMRRMNADIGRLNPPRAGSRSAARSSGS